MFGTEFIKGQGLGNQLFCYISARCIAKELGYQFGTAGQEQLANNIHSQQGMYFIDIDLGEKIENPQEYAHYHEKEDRMHLPNSEHDLKLGCYVAGADSQIYKQPDGTLLYGNLQAECYFDKYLSEIKEWLKVKPEYDSYEYTNDNLCIMNFRGGEYVTHKELYLDKKYWQNGMKHMLTINADMKFMIVTDDVQAANAMFPEIPAYHRSLDKDYVTVKNARYLILSNSSFACIPAMVSETVRYIIAPMYWARHNVSDGYWASEQNIYSGFHYMDRSGRVYTATECRDKLDEYKRVSKKYAKVNRKASNIVIAFWKIKCYGRRAINKLYRCILKIKKL